MIFASQFEVQVIAVWFPLAFRTQNQHTPQQPASQETKQETKHFESRVSLRFSAQLQILGLIHNVASEIMEGMRTVAY